MDGLKFDAGKPNWSLIPMEQLMKIIEVPQKIISTNNENFFYIHNDTSLYNLVLKHFTCWLTGDINEAESNNIKIARLPLAAFAMFFMLRGNPYNAVEILADKSRYRWDLFNIDDIQKVAEVYTYGAKLYTAYNWQKVEKERYVSAFFRHFKTARSKSRFDDESGLLHMYHAIWNVIALMWFDDQKIIKKAK